MSKWFEENRTKMFKRACKNVLLPQICGELSMEQKEQIAGFLSELDNDANDSRVRMIGIGDEVAQALSAEAVQMFDSDTINRFIGGAEERHVLDMKNVTVEPGEFIGDKLRSIADEIIHIAESEYSEGESFLIVSPLMISILQSASKTSYAPSIEGAFKGPNNTMLVGHLVEGELRIPIYSYLFGMDFYGRFDEVDKPGNSDTLILGNYNPETGKTRINIIATHNLFLA
jgi:hypothetical protein